MESRENKSEMFGPQIARTCAMKLIGLSLIFAMGIAQSQLVPVTRPKFEVASVKRCSTASLPAGAGSGAGWAISLSPPAESACNALT